MREKEMTRDRYFDGVECKYRYMSLEAVDFDGTTVSIRVRTGVQVPWLHTKRFRKEIKDFAALISLKLDDLAQFLAFNNGSVACKILINQHMTKSGRTFLRAFRILL